MKQKAKHEKSKKTSKGSALLLATVLLFVVLSMVVSLTYVTVMEQKMSGKTKSSVGSFFNADSGVEWALNKIANTDSEDTITAALSGITTSDDGSADCPFGGCKVYFLKDDGTVIPKNQFGALTVSDIKAVRSVGTQTAGGEATQRAIEAAVAGVTLNCRIVINSGCTVSCNANCALDEIAIGGGYKRAGITYGDLDGSFPKADLSGWTITIAGSSAYDAYALCCKK